MLFFSRICDPGERCWERFRSCDELRQVLLPPGASSGHYVLLVEGGMLRYASMLKLL